MQLALSSELAQTLVASVELADERVGATERAHIERLDAMRAECSNKLSSLQVGRVRGTATCHCRQCARHALFGFHRLRGRSEAVSRVLGHRHCTAVLCSISCTSSSESKVRLRAMQTITTSRS